MKNSYLTNMSPIDTKALHDKQQAIIDQVVQEMGHNPASVVIKFKDGTLGDADADTSDMAVKALWDGVSVASIADTKKLDADEKKTRWPDFFRIAQNLQRAIVEFKGGGSGDGKGSSKEITDDNPKLEDATGISSLVHPKHNMPGLHKIVLDIDHDAVLVKSSTHGHHHLIVDHYVNWEDYQELLRAMAKCNLIQKGYVESSINQGASWLRTPWARKGYGTTVEVGGVYSSDDFSVAGDPFGGTYNATPKSMTWSVESSPATKLVTITSDVETMKAQLQQLMMEKEIEKKEIE